METVLFCVGSNFFCGDENRSPAPCSMCVGSCTGTRGQDPKTSLLCFDNVLFCSENHVQLVVLSFCNLKKKSLSVTWDIFMCFSHFYFPAPLTHGYFPFYGCHVHFVSPHGLSHIVFVPTSVKSLPLGFYHVHILFLWTNSDLGL